MESNAITQHVCLFFTTIQQLRVSWQKSENVPFYTWFFRIPSLLCAQMCLQHLTPVSGRESRGAIKCRQSQRSRCADIVRQRRRRARVKVWFFFVTFPIRPARHHSSEESGTPGDSDCAEQCASTDEEDARQPQTLTEEALWSVITRLSTAATQPCGSRHVVPGFSRLPPFGPQPPCPPSSPSSSLADKGLTTPYFPLAPSACPIGSAVLSRQQHPSVGHCSEAELRCLRAGDRKPKNWMRRRKTRLFHAQQEGTMERHGEHGGLQSHRKPAILRSSQREERDSQ